MKKHLQRSKCRFSKTCSSETFEHWCKFAPKPHESAVACVHGEVWLPRQEQLVRCSLRRCAALLLVGQCCHGLGCRTKLLTAQLCPAGAEEVSDSEGVKVLYKLLYLSPVQRLLKKFVVVITSLFPGRENFGIF